MGPTCRRAPRELVAAATRLRPSRFVLVGSTARHQEESSPLAAPFEAQREVVAKSTARLSNWDPAVGSRSTTGPVALNVPDLRADSKFRSRICDRPRHPALPPRTKER